MLMDVSPTRRQRRALETDNKKWPETLVRIPREEWPPSRLPSQDLPSEAWRSRRFLIQIFYFPDGTERMSVCRTSHNGDSWEENITWDELQCLKRECGRGHKDAMEIYPSDVDVVNVANMRHLFITTEPIKFAWRKA